MSGCIERARELVAAFGLGFLSRTLFRQLLAPEMKGEDGRDAKAVMKDDAPAQRPGEEDAEGLSVEAAPNGRVDVDDPPAAAQAYRRVFLKDPELSQEYAVVKGLRINGG